MKSKIFFLFFIILALFSVSVLSESIYIDDLNNDTIFNQSITKNLFYSTNLYQIENTIYMVYLKNVSNTAQLFMTTSTDDGVTWTTPVQQTPNGTDILPCRLYTDIDKDLVCIRAVSDRIYYWIKKYASSSFETTEYEFKPIGIQPYITTTAGSYLNLIKYYITNKEDGTLVMYLPYGTYSTKFRKYEVNLEVNDYILNIPVDDYVNAFSDQATVSEVGPYYAIYYIDDTTLYSVNLQDKEIGLKVLNDETWCDANILSTIYWGITGWARYTSGTNSFQQLFINSTLPLFSISPYVRHLNYVYPSNNPQTTRNAPYCYFYTVSSSDSGSCGYYCPANETRLFNNFGSNLNGKIESSYTPFENPILAQTEVYKWMFYRNLENPNNMRIIKSNIEDNVILSDDIVSDISANITKIGKPLEIPTWNVSSGELPSKWIIFPYVNGSELYIYRFDTNDVGADLPISGCSATPTISSVSSSVANPVCTNAEFDWAFIYFNLTEPNECAYSRYFTCMDCNEDMSFSSAEGFKDSFNFASYNNETYSIPRNDSSLFYINGMVLLQSNSSISLKHCVYAGENWSANCFPTTNDFKFGLTMNLIDKTLNGTYYNPLDIRFMNDEGDYVAIFMINKTIYNQIEISQRIGALYYRVLGPVLISHNVNDMFVFNVSITTQSIDIDTFTDGNYNLKQSAYDLPFTTTSDNINSFELYEEACISNFTTPNFCEWPNTIDYLSVSTITNAYISQGYVEKTKASFYDIYEDIEGLSNGMHEIRICAYNSYSEHSLISCYHYGIEMKNDCTIQQIIDNGIDLGTDLNNTIYNPDDLASKWNAFLTDSNILSLGSKMIIGMIILIFLIIAIAMATGGNVIAISVVAVAGLMTMAVLGLFPVWVIVLTIVVCAIAVFVFFSSKGGS